MASVGTSAPEGSGERERPSERFPRSRRLREAKDFARARKRGRQVNGPLLALTFAPLAPTTAGTRGPGTAPDATRASEPQPSRVGFSVSKRVGGAVTRNLVKRRLREITRRCFSELAPGWDIIIVARTATADATYNALDTEVRALLSRAKLWRARPEHREERGNSA